MTTLWSYLVTALYAFIALPLLLTFIQQVRLIQGEVNNGLHFYRRALASIVFVYLLDALYMVIAFLFKIFGNVIIFDLLTYGLVFVLIKGFVCGGAWLYYFIYSQKKLTFLDITTLAFWKKLFSGE
jgi:ACR3 family arsenite efflux pump ArsB